jgi:hypothetical protein
MYTLLVAEEITSLPFIVNSGVGVGDDDDDSGILFLA